MGKSNRVFVGCDLGDKQSDYCVLDEGGRVLEEGRVRSTPAAFSKKFTRLLRGRVVIEVGTPSRWAEEVLRKLGHEVVVANVRQVHLIWKRKNKTDRSDAQMLARLGRLDVTLLAPVQHRSRAAQRDLAYLKARDVLVRSRTKLVNFVRGTMKPFGVRFPSCSPEALPKHADSAIPAELAPVLIPVVETIAALNERIAAQDEQIEQLAKAHPEATRLTQVNGVGSITALAFLLTLEDPARFRKSRSVGAFVGLTPSSGGFSSSALTTSSVDTERPATFEPGGTRSGKEAATTAPSAPWWPSRGSSQCFCTASGSAGSSTSRWATAAWLPETLDTTQAKKEGH